jgi:hypothetical protein
MGTVLKRIKKSTENYNKLIDKLKGQFFNIAGAEGNEKDEALIQLKEKLDEVAKNAIVKEAQDKNNKQERNKRKAEKKKNLVEGKGKFFRGAARSR